MCENLQKYEHFKDIKAKSGIYISFYTKKREGRSLGLQKEVKRFSGKWKE